MRRFIVISALLAIALVIAAAAAIGWAYHKFTAPGPLAEATTLIIPKGSNTQAIADKLFEAKIIDNVFLFKIWARVSGKTNAMRPGEYRFPKSVSQKGAMALMVEGRTVLRRVTIPEGLTTVQVLEIVNKAAGLEGAITSTPGEGDLLPDTYTYSYGDQREAMIQRMKTAMEKAMDEAWDNRIGDLPIKTKREMLVLASIVEKETSLAIERRRVSAVFVNRLRKGMRLETDPTVIYAITKGQGPLGRRLLRKDLEIDNPYNTYRNAGLPPGPIANPGRAALMAAVTPLQTKDLFFVADGTGGHTFAETLEQHNANVAKWRRIRREKDKEAD
ncbi:MAG: endolytic transglycosylase MltG [Alphaproteobacteria bacterium]